MSLSNYAEDKLLGHLLGIAAFTMPGAVYCALHTADPGETGAAGEVAGGSYARKLVTWSAITPGTGATSNSANLDWTNMPAATLTHVSLWDALSGGNCLGKGALSSPKVLGAGASFTIEAGDLDANLD